MQPIRRKQLKPGMLVEVSVNGKTIRGKVKEVVPPYKSGDEILVVLTSGTVGSIQRIVTKHEIEKETFKFYNLFFHSKHILTIWNKYTKETFTLQTKNQRTNKTEKSALLFSDEDTAQKVLQELNKEELALRRISRKKPITENFTNEGITYYRLNEKRKIPKERLNQLEEQFGQI